MLSTSIKNNQIFFLIPIQIQLKKLHGIKSSSPGIFQACNWLIDDLLKGDLLRIRVESEQSQNPEQYDFSHPHKDNRKIWSAYLVRTCIVCSPSSFAAS